MYSQQHFSLARQALLLAVIAAAYPIAGYSAVAGRVDFSIGQVVALTADGSQRPLQKGSEINAGEAIDTAAGARAQIRFTDGGYISLQPNTQFRVDEYQYEGKTDGKEKGFFSLLKGGLRAITGAVGHVNRDNYKVATPAATIGVRGTGYNAQLAEGLSISVTDGIISLTNKAGSLIITQGQSGYVADFNTAPQMTFEKPSTPPAGLSKGVTETVNKPTDPIVTDTGCAGCTPPPIQWNVATGLGNVHAASILASQWWADPNSRLDYDYPDTVIYNASDNARMFFVDSYGVLSDFTQATLDTATPAGSPPVSGNDGIVSWGRFTGTITHYELTPSGLITAQTVMGPNQGMHGIVGIPTATMPTTGSFSYDLIGATRPAVDSGGIALGTVTGGSMTVGFGSTYTVSGNLTFGFNSNSYDMSFNDAGLSGNHFTASASITSGCTATYACSAQVVGGFAGANAERAGIAYSMTDTAYSALHGAVRGVAVYAKGAACCF